MELQSEGLAGERSEHRGLGRVGCCVGFHCSFTQHDFYLRTFDSFLFSIINQKSMLQ